MTTFAEEQIRRRMEHEEAERVRYSRERDHLTVIKRTIVQAHCTRCNHTWPYREGDEDKQCPACQGGSGKFWSTSKAPRR